MSDGKLLPFRRVHGTAADLSDRALVAALAEGDQAAVTALRRGDVSGATRSSASACAAAERDALDEDACFWFGAAAKRAGDTKTARDALARFQKTLPSSARAGEASALLGWLLYDAG